LPGHPACYTTKIFAHYGGSTRDDGVWEQHTRSVLVLLGDDERQALLEDPRCYRRAYLGASGWVGLHVDGDTGLQEVAELIQTSYRITAGPRLVARLDAG
jgi:predicted DNA-binding protein (MmcQ/YjbR family)